MGFLTLRSALPVPSPRMHMNLPTPTIDPLCPAGWTTINDYQNGNFLPVSPAAAGVDGDGTFATACSKVGIYLAPNYQTKLSVEILFVVVRQDLDGDGIADDDEGTLASNQAVTDSDGDGVPDGKDVKPLDPLAGAAVAGMPLPIVCDSGVVVEGSMQLWSSENAVLLVVVGGSDGGACTLTWPHTASESPGTVTATEQHRSPYHAAGSDGIVVTSDLATEFTENAAVLNIRPGEEHVW